MGMINISKEKTINICDKIIEFFLYVLIFCLPFSKAAIEISATIVIFAWITKKILDWHPVHTYLNIPIFIYILAVFISVIFSSNFALSLNNFGSKVMEYIILFFIVCEFISNKRRLKNTVIIMLVSAAMIVADAVFQYVFGFDFLRHRTLEAGRITGSFQMPGDLAGYLGPVFCLPLSLAFLRLKKGIKYFLRIEALALIILVFFLLARGAWIGLVAALCFLGCLENKKITYVIIGSLLILGIIMVASHSFKTFGSITARLKTFVSLSDTSAMDRKAIWKVAVRMIKDKPLFGHGLSTFMGNFSKYGKDYFYLKQGIIPYAHNCYLQIAAETGIMGLMSFLLLIGTFLIQTIKSLMEIKDKFPHAVLSGISAGIIVTLMHSAVDTNLYSLQLSVLFWLMLGINAALQKDFVFEKVNQ